jgi:predicted secreted protein
MTYTILKTDGLALTSVVNGQIDQVTTDLTLIGKNSTGYGVFINDNFVHLLENFANTSQPNHPLKGQLWFDTTENRLKVYNGKEFVVSGGTLVASTLPSNFTAGDLWIDNVRQQLWFNDGISTKLAGPLYTADQGISGFYVEDRLDINQLSHTIVYLYVAQTLLGIFSKDAFTLQESINGMPDSLNIGFTASRSLPGLKFNVPVSQASYLISPVDSTLKTTADFIATSGPSQSTGTLSIANDTPLILGPGSDTQFYVSPNLFQIKSNKPAQNFEILTQDQAGQTHPAFFVNASNNRIGINTDSPQSSLDVNGSLTVQGNLNVLGTTTVISSTTLQVADKNIEIAQGNTDDSLANGGGITLHGATNKTFNWVSGTTSWTSSENINLITGHTYKINGQDVITSNSLGYGILSAPNLQTVGDLLYLQVANIAINNNTISYIPNGNTGNIVIAPGGTGSVDVDNSKIINVTTPSSATDAANKEYVDSSVTTMSLSTTLSVGTNPNPNALISTYLGILFPNNEHRSGTVCRVFVLENSSIRQFVLLGNPLIWTYQAPDLL